MTNMEVNKVIAEYMGWEKGANWWVRKDRPNSHHFECQVFIYTNSLDSLVPVWERLEALQLKYINDVLPSRIGCCVIIYIGNNSFTSGKSKSIQEAAAHCTAKAIMALGEQ